MIYLDLTDKIEKNNVIKILKEYNLNNKIIDKDKLIDDENELEKIKKADFIISDSDIETLKDYHALNKNVIIYRNRKSKSVDLFYEKGVYTYKYSNELREIVNHLETQNKKKKALLKLPLLILIIIVFIFILLTIYNNHQKELAREEKIRQEEVKKKRLELEKKTENIVFLGDSITHRYDLEKYYKGHYYVNSGVEGNRALDILKDLDGRIYQYNPTKVFILIGTNDIDKYYDGKVDEVYSNIIKIIEKIEKNRPKAKIYIESLLPINHDIKSTPSTGKNYNDIIQLNKKLSNYSKKQKIEYIDLYDLLVDEDGHLPPKYTIDGLHLNDNGYEIISKEIIKYINED